MSTSAGRVMPIPRGTYDSATTYHVLDIVTYNGSSYICKATTTGNDPTNTTYWQLNASGSAVSSLDEIGDVDITSVTNGQVIKYNSSSSKWVNTDDTISGASDTNITSPTSGQLLKYNSTSSKWENSAIGLNDNSDVDITSVANGQILKYNSTSSKWENETEYVILSQTLVAGSTTVTFNNAAITSTALIDIYTEGGIEPTAIDDTTTSTLVLTFDAQASDLIVKLKISEV